MVKFYLTTAVAALTMTASMNAAQPAEPTGEFAPITELPQGATSIQYAKHGISSGLMDTYFFEDDLESRGSACEIAFYENKIYINPMIEEGSEDSYIMGVVSDGVATFTFPQPLRKKADNFAPGGYYEDYAMLFDLEKVTAGSITGGEINTAKFTVSETQEISYRVEEDGALTLLDQNDKIRLGIGTYYADDKEWDWVDGFGSSVDYVYSFTPQGSVTPEIPADIVMEEYNYVSGSEGRKIEVGIGNDYVYIKGLCLKAPDAVMVGQIVGEKVVFEVGQVIGLDLYGGLVYFLPCTVTPAVAPDGYQYVILEQVLGNFVMTYDKENNIFTPLTALAFSSKKDQIQHNGWCQDFKIGKPNDAEIVVPDPVIESFKLSDGEYFSELWFTMSNVYADVNILDSDKLYFSIYIDGELFSFEPDEYPYIGASTTIVPYGHDDTSIGEDYSFAFADKSQGMIVYPYGFDTIGVQAVYKKSEEEVYRSNIVTYTVEYPTPDEPVDPGEDSISEVSAGNAAAACYDLSGRRVSSSAKGLIIERTATGARKVFK